MSAKGRPYNVGSAPATRRSWKVLLAAFLIFVLGAGFLEAQGRSLFFLELQGTAAHSSAADEIQLYSLMAGMSKQKPSLGFDFIHRISGENRDIGSLALQMRLAYNHRGEKSFELQIHNAYFRWKAGFADIWAGHSRPPLGLSYALDSHALLLPSPAMTGFGYDRDWGVGLHRDFAWGDIAAALTTGSGMPLYLKGNYLASFRISKGVLNRDNCSLGLSLAVGRVLDTMGLNLLDDTPDQFQAVAADGAYVWRNVENRVEVLLGRKAGGTVAHFFWRAGLNLLDEGRLKLEAQPVVRRFAGTWDYGLAGGASYRLNPDLTARAMIYYDHARHDARYVLQLYFYKNL